MRFIKLGVISFVVFFIILTALGLLLPGTARVTRTISIRATEDTVLHYINDVKYWKLWMESAKQNSIVFLSKKTAGKGTVAKIGTQQMSIDVATPQQIETTWKSDEGDGYQSIFQLSRDTTSNTTVVDWRFEKQVGWLPWQRLSMLSNDKLIGPGMEQSLDNLKAIFEGGR